MVEWADRTEEVRLGNEVVVLVQSATDNGFAERIELAGKAGFIRALSEAINTMSDKCQHDDRRDRTGDQRDGTG